MIAKHVMNIHMNRPGQNAGENGEVVGEIDIDKMRRYISYCKAYVDSQVTFDKSELTSSTANAHLGCLLKLQRC
jgi:DNA replication licensing factor MCM5